MSLIFWQSQYCINCAIWWKLFAFSICVSSACVVYCVFKNGQHHDIIETMAFNIVAFMLVNRCVSCILFVKQDRFTYLLLALSNVF